MGKVTSKLENIKTLSQHPFLIRHLPATQPLSYESFISYLHQYSSVYLKPDNSCQGKGIMRIDRDESGYLLRVRDDRSRAHFSTLTSLWNAVKKKKMKRPYLIQEAIASYTKSGNLFDIRVHLLRIHGRWIIGGIIGRIAPKHGVATNAYSGGIAKKIIPLLTEDLRLPPWVYQPLLDQLQEISVLATELISRKDRKWKEFGIDLGLDAQLHPWIYEVNIKPGMLVFHQDRETYERIMRLKQEAS
jgi:hypothetical protein